jgi:DNA helicase-2/ATP-dependent DNA helicase PcrA
MLTITSKKLIKEFIKPFKTALDSTEFSLTEGVVLDAISKAKAKGKTPAVMLEELEDPRKASKFVQGELPTQLRGIVAEIYMIYEKSLRKSNCLDFDDLLVFGVRLFREHPDTASWCKHILVDELWASFAADRVIDRH